MATSALTGNCARLSRPLWGPGAQIYIIFLLLGVTLMYVFCVEKPDLVRCSVRPRSSPPRAGRLGGAALPGGPQLRSDFCGEPLPSTVTFFDVMKTLKPFTK